VTSARECCCAPLVFCPEYTAHCHPLLIPKVGAPEWVWLKFRRLKTGVPLDEEGDYLNGVKLV